jgi:hypothetical protein
MEDKTLVTENLAVTCSVSLDPYPITKKKDGWDREVRPCVQRNKINELIVY